MLRYLDDQHPLENWTAQRNLARQYDFMNTAFRLWQDQDRPPISLSFLCDLNFYAAHLLSPHPGKFRDAVQQNVDITNTPHTPPIWEEIEDWLATFLHQIHQMNASEDPFLTAAYALWRLNWIHPFVQGNGRTARAACYFILCQRLDLWLPGTPIIPEQIRATRQEYCDLLKDADLTAGEENLAALQPLSAYLQRLLTEQLQSISTN